MTGFGDDVTTGARGPGCAVDMDSEQLVTPSDKVLLGPVSDQVE